MTAYERLALRALATIIRIILRDRRDDGGDTLLLAEKLEKAANREKEAPHE